MRHTEETVMAAYNLSSEQFDSLPDPVRAKLARRAEAFEAMREALEACQATFLLTKYHRQPEIVALYRQAQAALAHAEQVDSKP